MPVEGDLRGPGTSSQQLRPDRRDAEAVLHVSRYIIQVSAVSVNFFFFKYDREIILFYLIAVQYIL